MQHWRGLARLLPAPENQARLKQDPDDFQVWEEPGFAFTGAGEHLCVEVEKTGLTTTEAARRLGAAAGVALRTVGYAGMKDRRARTRQWFSLPLAQSAEKRLAQAEDDSLRILRTRRNSRKIRIGSHRANHFTILLRDFRGCREDAGRRLEALAASGVPNYFGPQRFGARAGNLTQLESRIRQQSGAESAPRQSRVERARLYSTARAMLFNEVLSSRLAQGNWGRIFPGDIAALEGSGALFEVEAENPPDVAQPEIAQPEIAQQRLDARDIHVTGPLAGAKSTHQKYVTRGKAADIENAALQKHQTVLEWLIRQGVQSGRRPLRFIPRDLHWDWNSGNLQLRFALGRGCYATSLIRELCDTDGSEPGIHSES